MQLQKHIIQNLLQGRDSLVLMPTGGGKSMLYQCSGTIFRGVNLIIRNTLSLSSDQASKFINCNQVYGNINAIQLDTITSEENVRNVTKYVLSFTERKDAATVFLFTSPEMIQKPQWKKLVDFLIRSSMLKMVVVDEVHQFIQYGSTFRPAFRSLKDYLFRKLILRQEYNTRHQLLKVPIVFMTATFSSELIEHLNIMTDIKLYPSNIFWSDKIKFSRRNIRIQTILTSQKKKKIKDHLCSQLGTNYTDKAIIFSSTAKAIESTIEDVDNFINYPDTIEGDCVLINGDMESSWKNITAREFTASVDNPKTIIESNNHCPRILGATAGCIGAGLDCEDVKLVRVVDTIGLPMDVNSV